MELSIIDRIKIEDRDGVLCTTSLNVAEVTGKSHHDVLRDIRNLVAQGEQYNNSLSNNGEESHGADLHHEIVFKLDEFFTYSQYISSRGRKEEMVILTEKGTAWLLGRYTGPNAVRFQLAYHKRYQDLKKLALSLHEQLIQSQSNQILRLEDTQEYISIKGYHRLTNRIITLSEAQSLGKICSNISKSLGYDIKKVPDMNYGLIGAYKFKIVKKVSDTHYIRKLN